MAVRPYPSPAAVVHRQSTHPQQRACSGQGPVCLTAGVLPHTQAVQGQAALHHGRGGCHTLSWATCPL